LTINNNAPRLAGGQKWSYKPLRVGFNPQGAYQFLAHMKQILVSIFIFLSACGMPRTYESHSDFNKYKERFEQETGVGVSVPSSKLSMKKKAALKEKPDRNPGDLLS